MRILFVTANRVGDAVLSTESSLLGGRPNIRPQRYTIAAGPAAISLFRALPNLHRLIVMEKNATAHWLSLWRDCVASRWDIIVDLRRSHWPTALWPVNVSSFQKQNAKCIASNFCIHDWFGRDPSLHRRSGLRIRQKMKRQAAKRSPSRQPQIDR